MDIYCSKCGEPWEIDSIHDVAEELQFSFDEALKAFKKQGCEILGASHGEVNENRAAAVSVLFDIMGDDVDGIAAMLEDFDVDTW